MSGVRPAAVLALLSVGLSAALAANPEKMGLWVPLYVLPKGPKEPEDEYTNLIKSVEADKCIKDSFHGTVLTGPRSGPPNPSDEKESALYRERFSVVGKTQQWTAFGYITTLYTKRDINLVLKDIEIWLTSGKDGFGDYVQGIWVDNVAVNPTGGIANPDYYAKVAAKIRSFGKLVAFNPGVNVGDCAFLEKNEVSFVNNFEDYYERWLPSSTDECKIACPCAGSSVTRCIASIHKYPTGASTSELMQSMKVMASRGYSAIFLTDRVMPDHYLKLPTFWPSVVDAACKTVLDGSTATITKANCAARGGKSGAAKTVASTTTAEDKGEKNTLPSFVVPDDEDKSATATTDDKSATATTDDKGNKDKSATATTDDKSATATTDDKGNKDKSATATTDDKGNKDKSATATTDGKSATATTDDKGNKVQTATATTDDKGNKNTLPSFVVADDN